MTAVFAELFFVFFAMENFTLGLRQNLDPAIWYTVTVCA
jgi:hypothetical protein